MRIPLQAIASKVCECENITIDELKGERRLGQLCMPRHYFCYLARVENYHYEEIAVFLHRHHSTVISSYRNLTGQIPYDKQIRRSLNIYDRIMSDLKENEYYESII